MTEQYNQHEPTLTDPVERMVNQLHLALNGYVKLNLTDGREISGLALRLENLDQGLKCGVVIDSGITGIQTIYLEEIGEVVVVKKQS